MIDLKSVNLLEDNPLWYLSVSQCKKLLILTWKKSLQVSDQDYHNAIMAIATHSLNQKPRLIIIDKRNRTDSARFDQHWWHTTIVPRYHQAGIAGIAHITGDITAKGLFPNPPAGLKFLMAEFNTIESALEWQF